MGPLKYLLYILILFFNAGIKSNEQAETFQKESKNQTEVKYDRKKKYLEREVSETPYAAKKKHKILIIIMIIIIIKIS